MKYLIINADDFGLSHVFNKTILNLIEKDKITSTTVMIDRVDAKDAEKLAKLKKTHKISIGLHLDFAEKATTKEIKRQFDKFESVFGFEPSHLDIHKFHPETHKCVAGFAKQMKLCCRNHGDAYTGAKTTNGEVFFGTVTDFSDIEDWLATLNDKESYEILFHPGKYDKDCKSSINKEREQDTKNILKLNKILKKLNIKKISWLELN
jgi:predicted glycoside hydrolase/deacetylase ChbG (UPF0249 family)